MISKKVIMKILVLILFLSVSLIESVPVENVNEVVNKGALVGGDDLNLIKTHKVDISALFNDIKKLKAKKSEGEIRRIATAGILAGAMNVERNMNEHLAALTQDFFAQFNSTTPEDNMEKLFRLEQTMERDKRAMEILVNALDFAINSKSFEEYKEDMDAIARSSEISMIELAKKKFATQMTSNNTAKGEKVGKLLKHSDDLKVELTKRMEEVRSSINKHIYSVHSTLNSRAKKTIKYLKEAKATPKPIQKQGLGLDLLKNFIHPKASTMSETTTDSSMDYTDEGGYQTFPPSEKESRLAGLFNRIKRQDSSKEDDKENEIDGSAMSGEKQSGEKQSGSQSESESGSSEEEGPGGIVGLIASLSGGDEGSDIGALIGALTGLVTNLFGPGGLDVPSLLGTATSLLAGLLAGEENFGKVLGTYVGVSVDGFSGGGGAIMNGQFFGQFLGTVLAQLSADPEDEDLPPKPSLFIENVFSGSKMAYSKADTETAKEGEHKPSGSDLFGFITNVVSSIVGGITSLILNASLGSSGGSSQGSADLSGGSSAASSSSDHKPDPDQHHH